MSGQAATLAGEKPKGGILQRLLDGIERVGNKVPHPALLFLTLIVIIIVLSQILAWAGVSATYEVIKPPPVQVEDGIADGCDVPESEAGQHPQPRAPQPNFRPRRA